MNDPRQFDELARRKLEEREFAFDQAAWTDMQRILAKDSGRGGAWKWWTLAGAAALLIGLGLWWNAAGEQPADVAEAIEVSPTRPAVGTDAKEKSETAAAEVNVDPAPAEVAVVPHPAEPVKGAGSAEPAKKSSPQVRKDEPRMVQPATPRAEPDAITVAESEAPKAEIGSPEIPVAVPAAAAGDPPANEAIRAPTNGTNDVTDEPVPDRDGTTEILVPLAVPAIALNDNVADAGDPTTTGTKDTAADPTTENEANTPVPTPEATTPEVAAAAAPMDSASTATNDEVPVPVPPAPASPVLVPAKAPWEISALGGMMLGSSNYSGANSDTWKDDVSSLWAPGVGGELMHMGRNFGLGVGLHYTTYAEQLQVAQQTVTETLTSDSNYFEPTPMMLLIVTDVVVIDGVTYYVTETLDTTINVLVRSTMTTTGERVVVPARDQTNRVSYFEIPVLFDAHLVQGPWSLGIRGGPMVGLLSGRQGVVPNAAMDGYTDFSDQRFTEVVFGYAARAYVRYRFSDAWSVGLEPGIKGQLMNGLAEGDLSRRTTAWGGMLSVSYRLR